MLCDRGDLVGLGGVYGRAGLSNEVCDVWENGRNGNVWSTLCDRECSTLCDRDCAGLIAVYGRTCFSATTELCGTWETVWDRECSSVYDRGRSTVLDLVGLSGVNGRTGFSMTGALCGAWGRGRKAFRMLM
jgi:hypothetical protein